MTEVLVIGGVGTPIGPYAETMDVLASGHLEAAGIRKVGVAGHPEGSPDISADGLAIALAAKNEWATRTGIETYIETQFCFDAGAILKWEKSIRAAGNVLPIHIGVPGLASLKTLLKFAQISGIGPSMRVLTRQTRNITRLLSCTGPGQAAGRPRKRHPGGPGMPDPAFAFLSVRWPRQDRFLGRSGCGRRVQSEQQGRV